MIARSVGRSVGRSIGASGFVTGGGGPSYDTDAQAYITLVEAADSQSLETGVKDAINAFVVGCKSDGIWDAIKAACILAGARTLDGALVPLVGTAPTNNNFVSGDYDRKLGLVGDGATKYLDSNRANDDDPKDDNHIAAYMTDMGTEETSGIIGAGRNTSGATIIFKTSGSALSRSRSSSLAFFASSPLPNSLVGISRNNSANYDQLENGTITNRSSVSQTPTAEEYNVFASNNVGVAGDFNDARLSFYSIGEALDLALLDSRVSTLMTAIGAAIP